MTTISTIQMLTRYNAWVNRAIEAVEALPVGDASPTINRYKDIK
jgi:hypothetical protein